MAEVRNARWHRSAPITLQREHLLSGTLICSAQTSSSPTMLPIQTHQKYSVAAKLPMPNPPCPAGKYPLTSYFHRRPRKPSLVAQSIINDRSMANDSFNRITLIVLDGSGIGQTPDAAAWVDAG